MKASKQDILVVVATFIRYFGDCLFYGYIYLFLLSKGLLESQIGTITCLTPLIAMAINPLWNLVAKNVNKGRILMMILGAIEGIFISIYANLNGFELFIIFTILIALVGSPYYSLHDGFIDTYASLNNRKYAFLRSFGTIGYLIASLFAAMMLKITSNDYLLLFYICTICFIITTALFIFIKPLNLKMIAKEEVVKQDYKQVLTNKKFIVYLVIFTLSIAVSKAIEGYNTTYFKKMLGQSETTWSLVFAICLIIETIVLWVLQRVKKINLKLCLVFVALCYFAKIFIYSFDIPLWVAILATSLRGFAFGAFSFLSIAIIEESVGIKNVTCAIFIISIIQAVITSIFIFASGHMIDSLGYQKFHLIISIILFIGVILALFNFLISLKRKKEST